MSRTIMTKVKLTPRDGTSYYPDENYEPDDYDESQAYAAYGEDYDYVEEEDSWYKNRCHLQCVRFLLLCLP